MEHTNPRDYHTRDNLTRLRKGLKHFVRTDSKVAIVGAGMAGLVCAWLLKDAGFGVTVYEASNKVGGRVRTLREGFTSGWYAEAGAMRIPKSHKLTNYLCERFKLKLAAFPEQDNNCKVFINGSHFRMSDYKSGDFSFGAPYIKGRNAEDALNRTTRRLQSVFKPDPRKFELDSLPSTQRADLDSLSFGEYLRAFLVKGAMCPVPFRRTATGRSKRYRVSSSETIALADIDLMGFDFGASDFKASFLEAYRDHVLMGGSTKFQILGGMDLLPKALAKTMTDDLRFHARVIEVLHDGEKKGFRIRHEHSVTHARFDPPDFADYVVLAAPFSALTHVRLKEPVVTAAAIRAIRNLHYENAAKIILEFSERFWENDGIINGGRSFTDLPIRWVHYPSQAQIDWVQKQEKNRTYKQKRRGLLLASYTWGEDSLRWGSLRPDDRIRFALRDIATLHGKDHDELERLLVGGMSHSWAEDEYAFGAFALFDPHQETELFDNAWTPHDGLHFAGEHTSLKHAWIEGAVESGIRAAVEVFREETEGRRCV